MSRDVFPEPLGPMRRMVGRFVDEGERNMTRWRNKGMVRTTRMVMRIAVGVGSNKEDSRFREDSQVIIFRASLGRWFQAIG